jgi:hypothetical protein
MFTDLRSGTATVLQASQGAFSQFFTNITSGTMKAKDAFRQLATSILQSMQQVLSNELAKQFMSMLIGSSGGSSGMPGGLFGSLGSLFGGGGGDVSGLTNLDGSGFAAPPEVDLSSMIPDFAVAWQGGRPIPRHYSLGGADGIPTRDSVPALLAPGEIVMRQSAVDLIGADTLDTLNAMGNSRISQSAPVQQQQAPPQTPHQTNVYVVNQDQAPTGLGPQDVMAIWTKDVMTGGAGKKLIKQVISGAV